MYDKWFVLMRYYLVKLCLVLSGVILVLTGVTCLRICTDLDCIIVSMA